MSSHGWGIQSQEGRKEGRDEEISRTKSWGKISSRSRSMSMTRIRSKSRSMSMNMSM